MRPEDLVGHLECLIPQERYGQEEMINLGHFCRFFEHNTVYVSFVERFVSVIRNSIDPSASNLILHERWFKAPKRRRGTYVR